MKKDVTTVLGIFIIFCAAIITFSDMYLSTMPGYSFELEGWHIFTGFFTGVALVIIPQNKLVQLFTWVIKKIVGSKFGNDGKNKE